MNTYPSLYHPSDVTGDFYNARIAEFAEEGRRAGLRPASQDKRKIALNLIDVQWDFVHPTGYLSVPGALDDLHRTIDFIYANVEQISSIFVSMDTHREYQIFYSTWWAYEDNGEHPAPLTRIGLNKKGEAVNLKDGRRMMALIAPVWSYTYLRELKLQAQKDLMIWPFHTMDGTQGHALMPALREALAFYSTARVSQVNYITKGTSPYTEHYGIWSTEVPYPKDPSTGLNTLMLDALGNHDLIYLAGQAEKHCVFETARQHLNYYRNQPDAIHKMRFLQDCTSPVPGMPQAFEDETDREMASWAHSGLQFVNAADPIG